MSVWLENFSISPPFFSPMRKEERGKPKVHKGRPLSEELTPMPYHRNEREREREKGAGENVTHKKNLVNCDS